MEEEIRELQRRYKTKRQPILDVIEIKKQQNWTTKTTLVNCHTDQNFF